MFRGTMAVAVALGGLWAAQASGQQSAGAELDALIRAAKAEGQVVFYSGATENIAKRTAEAFTAKYGVKASFVRIPGATLVQRYSNEAQAGTFAADLFMVSAPAPADALKNNWVEPIREAGIPAIREFPARFILGASAVIQIAPWGIAYHNEKVKGADVPKDWADLLHPRFKGQILLPDPRSADAYADHWGLLIDRLGEGYLQKLREQSLRLYPSGVPAVNALAAGEGMIAVPAVGALVQAMVDKKAPLAMTQPALASGVEMQLSMTHRAKNKHPNAARLFAHYVMTPEGNKVYNADPGSLSVFDTSRLPKQYESPKPGAVARMGAIAKLLGTQ